MGGRTMAGVTKERELYDTIVKLEDGSARPGHAIAARALDLLDQGRPFAAMNLCLRAMRQSSRWWSLAAAIGQRVPDEHAETE